MSRGFNIGFGIAPLVLQASPVRHWLELPPQPMSTSGVAVPGFTLNASAVQFSLALGNATPFTGSGPPPPPPPVQQMKFFNGFYLESQGYEFGTSFATSGTTQATSFPGGYIGEINQLPSCPNIGAYMVWFKSSQLEDYTQPTNLALTQAAGATGVALQNAINAQYPGFAKIAQAFYYQQAVRYNSPFMMGVNFIQLNITLTPAEIQGNWGTGTTNPRVVPQDVATCGGTLTVPTSYGATTTTTYAVAPVATGISAWGMNFNGWNGSTAYVGAVPAWQNPGVNYRDRIQIYQALALWQLPAGLAYSGATTYTPGTPVTYQGSNYLCIANSTGNLPTNSSFFVPNPWAGLTPDQNQQFVYHKNNDEYSYNFSTGPYSPPTAGSSGFPATPTTFAQAHDTWVQAVCAAMPSTPFGDCTSYGASFGGNGADTNTTMAFLINALLPSNPRGTSRIRGYVHSNSDTYINEWNLIAGDEFPQAPATYAAGIGWGVAPNVVPASWPVSGQIPHVAQYDLTGLMMKDRQVQNGDYRINSFNVPPEPAPNTQAAVTSIINNAVYEGATMVGLSPTSDSATGGQPAYSNLYWNDATHGFIYPGLTTWINANKTALNPTGLPGQLPRYAMYGPTITCGGQFGHQCDDQLGADYRAGHRPLAAVISDSGSQQPRHRDLRRDRRRAELCDVHRQHGRRRANLLLLARDGQRERQRAAGAAVPADDHAGARDVRKRCH